MLARGETATTDAYLTPLLQAHVAHAGERASRGAPRLHAILRWTHRCAALPRPRGPALGPRWRRGRCGPGCRGGGLRQRRRLRHGRDLHRRLPDRGRRVRAGLRDHRRRRAGQGPDAAHSHRRRRWGLALPIRRLPPHGGAGERRRRPRSALLRKGRCDGRLGSARARPGAAARWRRLGGTRTHRCEPVSRTHPARALSLPPARSAGGGCPGRAGRRAAHGGTPALAGRDRGRLRRDRQRQHGPGDPGGLRRARCRPARLRSGGLRRSGRPARLRPGPETGDPDHLAPPPRRPALRLRDRHCRGELGWPTRRGAAAAQ